MRGLWLAVFVLLACPLAAAEAVSTADGTRWLLEGATLIRTSADGGTTVHPLPFEAQLVRPSGNGLWVVGRAAAARVALSGAIDKVWRLPKPAERVTGDAAGNLWIGGTRLAPDGTVTAGSRASHVPVREMIGFLALSGLLSLTGLFRFFGGR